VGLRKPCRALRVILADVGWETGKAGIFLFVRPSFRSCELYKQASVRAPKVSGRGLGGADWRCSSSAACNVGGPRSDGALVGLAARPHVEVTGRARVSSRGTERAR